VSWWCYCNYDCINLWRWCWYKSYNHGNWKYICWSGNKKCIEDSWFFDKKEIKVYKGASRPLINKLQRGAKIHGEDGLGDIELKYSERKEEDLNAIDAIYKISKVEKFIDIITLGPLTNISIALNLYPDLKNYINVIYAMGGAIDVGNVTKFAEFNFYADPEAVQNVLDSKSI